MGKTTAGIFVESGRYLLLPALHKSNSFIHGLNRFKSLLSKPSLV